MTMSAAEDIEAIDRYFRAHMNDVGAAPQYKAWREWYDSFRLWWSDDDLVTAKKRRDILNTALGIKSLTEQGMNPVELREPLEMTTSGGVTSVKIFAGGGAPPVIRKGSRGAAVTKWQQIVGVTADGNFGSGTETATKTWQARHGITADGIVGAQSWTAAGIRTVSDLSAEIKTAVDRLAAEATRITTGVTAGTAVASGYPTIQYGSTGPDVVRWQRILGLSPADGSFGPATDAATKKWQTNHGIVPDGVVGPMTWKAAENVGVTPTVPAGFKPPPVIAPVAPVKPAVTEAGVMGFLGNLPTWGKWALGLGVAAGVVSQASQAGKSGRGKHQ
jgi:peptidoglycan hydrolase-like protein with peptidoglycan-binding domain